MHARPISQVFRMKQYLSKSNVRVLKGYIPRCLGTLVLYGNDQTSYVTRVELSPNKSALKLQSDPINNHYV